MAKNFDQKMLSGLAREVSLYLGKIRTSLENIQATSNQRQTLEDVYRYIHTIKAASTMLGTLPLGYLTSSLEDVCVNILQDSGASNATAVVWLRQEIDHLEQYVQALLSDAATDDIVAAVVHAYRRYKGLPESDDAEVILAIMSGHAELPTITAPQGIAEIEAADDEFPLLADVVPVPSLSTPTPVDSQAEEQQDDEQEERTATQETKHAAAMQPAIELSDEEAWEASAATSMDPDDAEVISEPPVLVDGTDALDRLLMAIDSEVEQTYSHVPSLRSAARELEQQAAKTERYVMFTLAGSRFAVAIPSVLEVSRLSPITPVPYVPTWLRGVINLRGDIISVVDLSLFLGIGETRHTESNRLLVVQLLHEELTTALLVDQLHGIVRISPQALSISATRPVDKATPYLDGLYDHADHTLAVLDVERFLLSPELRQFE